MSKKHDHTHSLSQPFGHGGPLGEKAVMENIINSMSDGVLLIDRQGEIILLNPALTQILELDAQEIKAKGWAQLFLDEPDNESLGQVMVDIIQNHVCHYNRQVRYRAPSGAVKDLIATTTLMTSDNGDSDDLVGVLVVFNDVTELVQLHRRQNELLERSRLLFKEKLAALDRLARAVAHEIRNPVMTIGGLAHRLLETGECTSKGEGYLHRVLASSTRLELIVREVRDYADLPVPRLAEVDLGRLAGQAAARHTGRAKRQGVRVELTGEAGEEGVLLVRADEALLNRLLDALLDNALDAQPDGGRLAVRLESDGDNAKLSVIDEGRGVSPADRPYLFDPFYTTKADAVGMSLAIAKRIALDHQGDLTAEPRRDCGTVFSLTLPLQADDLAAHNGQPARQPNLK